MGVNRYVTGFFPYDSIFLKGEITEILRYAIQDHAITAGNEDYDPVKIKAFRSHFGRAPGFRFSSFLPVINIQTILENLQAGLTFRITHRIKARRSHLNFARPKGKGEPTHS
jgi:hypothetical protein